MKKIQSLPLMLCTFSSFMVTLSFHDRPISVFFYIFIGIALLLPVIAIILSVKRLKNKTIDRGTFLIELLFSIITYCLAAWVLAYELGKRSALLDKM